MSSPALDVRYTAQLARIRLSEEEIATFQAQLDQVIEYVEKLKQVDVTGVEPTAHTVPVFNVFRPDVSRDWFDAATGDPLARFSVGKQRISGPLVVAGGLLLVFGDGGELTALRATALEPK